MSIHEECGVIGIISRKASDTASMAYYGLYALQHRGQESCGFDGSYPTTVPSDTRKDRFEQKLSQKKRSGCL